MYDFALFDFAFIGLCARNAIYTTMPREGVGTLRIVPLPASCLPVACLLPACGLEFCILQALQSQPVDLLQVRLAQLGDEDLVVFQQRQQDAVGVGPGPSSGPWAPSDARRSRVAASAGRRRSSWFFLWQASSNW